MPNLGAHSKIDLKYNPESLSSLVLLPNKEKLLTTIKSKPDFAPSLFHPFYFVRSGLRDKIRKYAPQLNGKLMDFGCGSKPYKQFFNVEEYIGVDFMNEGHSHENEQIDVFYDGRKIPLPDAYFDSVLSSEVFEHIFNPNEIMGEINRVMKPGGNLLISCPFTWNEHEVPNDYARYTRFALADILSKNGFEIVEISKSGEFISAIFQLWNLYFYHNLYVKVQKISLFRWLYKAAIVFPINLMGIVLSSLFKSDSSLYLNTIVLARKNVLSAK